MQDGEHAGKTIWLKILIVLKDNRIIDVDIYKFFDAIYILGCHAQILADQCTQGLTSLNLQ